jgi:hypothetical protein
MQMASILNAVLHLNPMQRWIKIAISTGNFSNPIWSFSFIMIQKGIIEWRNCFLCKNFIDANLTFVARKHAKLGLHF